MLGLPSSTAVRQNIPKQLIIEKGNLSTADRRHFDSDIHSITIVGELSENTVNIHAGKGIRRIMILEVRLRTEDYSRSSLLSIYKAIDQRMALLLRSENRFRLAVYNDLLIEGEWSDSEPELRIEGIDLDSVWNNLVISIGGITLEENRTLSEQIAKNEEHRKILMEIDRLSSRMAKEKQPRIQREIYARIKELREQL